MRQSRRRDVQIGILSNVLAVVVYGALAVVCLVIDYDPVLPIVLGVATAGHGVLIWLWARSYLTVSQVFALMGKRDEA